MCLEFRKKSIKMELDGFKMRRFFFKSTSYIKIPYKVTRTISTTIIFCLTLLQLSVFHRPAYGVYQKLEFQTRNKIIVFNGLLVLIA